jgi:hypothetical protein
MAEEGKRPGGLTALAVLNFVFGGLGVLGILALVALLSLASAVVSEASGGTASVSSAPGAGIVYLLIALSIVQVILMIVSGVGYLQLKKFLGRTLGNAYAVVSILGSVLGIALAHTGFGFSTIIGLVYPILTLFLLNVTFKDAFVK